MVQPNSQKPWQEARGPVNQQLVGEGAAREWDGGRAGSARGNLLEKGLLLF